MLNPFIKDKNDYKRNIDILGAYHNDVALYLSKMTGKPFNDCLQFVKKETGKEGKFPVRDPDVLCLTKNKYGDREKTVLKFSEYLKESINNKDLIAPTFTTYIHPKKKKSLLALYIDGNLKKRSKLKKEALVAKMEKKLTLYKLRENQQNSTKIKNNALSGAHASNGTPLANKSSHSTLTSVCRCATSNGNANNEKFISGNRHYWCPDIVKANIMNICNNVDMKPIELMVKQFNLKIPSVDEVMDCIAYSTNLYWHIAEETKFIKRLVSGLTDLERATFVYVGDLYHLTKHNDSVIRDFVDQLVKDPEQIISMEEAEKIIKSIDSDLTVYVNLLTKDEMIGITLNNAKEEKPDTYRKVASRAKNILSVLEKYQDFLKAFFVTDTMPTSIANLPNSIRRSALASDTDSTIFTVQEWAKWYSGKYDYSKKSCAAADTITYLTSQAIIHILAMLCTNMGVDKDDISRLQMKNEYSFPVFTLTTRAKHYYALKAAREGNIYEVMEKEIKGVGLRPSYCPQEILDKVHETMQFIMDSILSGKKISINEILDTVAHYENKIRHSVESGKYEYLTKSRINAKSAYKVPQSSAYVYHELWSEVFADKYGHCEEPPYTTIKVSIDCDNKTAVDNWLTQIEDVAIREKFRQWLLDRGKFKINNILLPESIIAVTGLPQEIICGIDIRKLIYETVKPFYIVLESLGIFMIDDNNSRLVSDFHRR